MKKKYQSGDHWLIQTQILLTNIIRIVWETERRITYEILGVKGLIIVMVKKNIMISCIVK